jgi:membrane-bound metal-dependent hydrolase YbcI (DUF457 family)
MMTLNHGFSGYVCGRVAMPVLKRYSPLSERAMGWAFFLGAMMPDGDVIIRVFAGRGDYFGRTWYSHRQFSHSLLGTLVEALIVAAVLFGPLVWRAGLLAPSASVRRRQRRRAYAWAVGCLWVGGMLHLLGDMVTPSRPLPVFWPLPYSFGGWAHIGWFSPYLLAMFLTVLLIDVLARGVTWLNVVDPARWRPRVAAAVWLVYAAAAFRWFQYMGVSRYESPSQWAAYQHALLPEPLVAAATDGIALLWSLIAR